MRRPSSLALVALGACALSFCALAPSARADGDARAVGKRVCLSAGETRDQIKALRLREPFAVLK